MSDPEPVFFSSPAEFAKWLAKNHAARTELWVGYHKVATGKPSMTWAQSVDEALCYGWIDGIRKRVDDEGYMIRFTPRKPRSQWSAVNLRRIAALEAEGRVQPAGRAAFEARRPGDTGYSYEERNAATLAPADEKRFRANAAAWNFFNSQPPSYRGIASFWVVSAKKEETRQRRLTTLITDSAAGRRLSQLARPAK